MTLIRDKPPKYNKAKNGGEFQIITALEAAPKVHMDTFEGDEGELAVAIDKWYGKPFT